MSDVKFFAKQNGRGSVYYELWVATPKQAILAQEWLSKQGVTCLVFCLVDGWYKSLMVDCAEVRKVAPLLAARAQQQKRA